MDAPKENQMLSGILIKKNFNCNIVSPAQLTS